MPQYISPPCKDPANKQELLVKVDVYIACAAIQEVDYSVAKCVCTFRAVAISEIYRHLSVFASQITARTILDNKRPLSHARHEVVSI